PRSGRLREGLKEIYAALPSGIRLLVEYKFFEPGFYSTDLPDWGTAYAMCLDLGPHAEVLVDTGHHAQSVNIEQIVAQLLDRARLGGFHFNARKYADDDLIVGSANPFELFLIFNELVAAEEDSDDKVAATARNVALMIDQSHNIEPKLEAMVQSVINIQTAHAKALLVDRARLRQAQTAGDVLAANRVLVEAYETDVRPILAEARKRLGIDPDPVGGASPVRRRPRRSPRRRAGRLDGNRHLGGRLRIARPRRPSVGQPGPLPRPTHGRDARRGRPPNWPRGDLRANRHPVHADQHALPAAGPGDFTGSPARGGRSPADYAGSAGLLADRGSS